MSKIEELLKNEKVEWKKLGEVCEDKFWIMPSTPKFKETGIPYITGKNIKKWRIDFNDVKYISQNVYNDMTKNRKIQRDDILISMIGTIGEVAVVETLEQFYGQNLYLLRLNKELILNRYFLHYFSQATIQNSIISKKNSSSQGYIRAEQLQNIEIPIPSLETQEKIVNILDKFTKYVTELQAELQARIRQYNYYRDMLLSESYLNKLSSKLDNFDDREYQLICIELGEIIKIRNGKDWKGLGEGNIPVYGSGGNMNIYVDKYSYNKPTVLIPRKGSIENVFYLEEPFWNVDTIFYTEIDETRIIPKYFYYFIENYDIKSLSTDSTRPSLTQSVLNKVKIKLPPLVLQNKVVEILDKFQELIENNKGLLPEEIEQRQKQYEYYREKLLTFETKCDTTQRNATQRNAT